MCIRTYFLQKMFKTIIRLQDKTKSLVSIDKSRKSAVVLILKENLKFQCIEKLKNSENLSNVIS